MMLKSWMAAALACVALQACAPGTGGQSMAGDRPEGAAPAATSVRLIDRDVEAPEVYQTDGKALWDGRPSLGGVWVAANDARNPERVIMRNPANGKFVIGGLFQREASMPGPNLQLSSDAADALGLLAGEPAAISVTALRREEAPVAKPDATKPLLDANAPAGSEVAGTEVAATAAAAIDAATGAKPADGTSAPPAKPVAGQPAPAKPAASKPADPARPAVPAKPAAKPAAEPATPVAPADPAASGSLIQIGIFSVEANAKRATDLLAKAGVTASTAKETSLGKALWSVTARGDAALLAKIKGAGFKDAYVLKR